MKYRPEIDGLRAIAVFPVILFHAGFELFSGGFVGVDVFFVISGYLITTILIDDIEGNRFNIINFYERRARRILPALFFVMLCCIPFALMWMIPSQLKDFSQSLAAVSLFSSNILFWLESGYFDAAAEEKPLLHTWSLAVEEQYYLIFPIFLFIAFRFGKNRVLWTIVILAAISLALSEWGWKNKPAANFYLAPMRAWELFAGSIAAFILQRKGVQTSNTLSLLGLAAIFFSIFSYDENTPFPSVYALVPVTGVVLLVLYAGKETLAAKLLSTKILVGIGLISYSAYLWHQPLFAFARIRSLEAPSEYLMLSLIALSLALAFLSWKFIESPFRDKKSYSRKAIFSASCVFGTLFLSLGLAGQLIKDPSPTLNPETFSNWQDTSDCIKNNSIIDTDMNDVFDNCFTEASVDRFILIGDSHASAISKELRASIENAGGELVTLIADGCLPIPGTSRLPLLGNCLLSNQIYWDFARRVNATTILSSRWRLFLEGSRYDNGEGGVEYGGNAKNVVVNNESSDIYAYAYSEILTLTQNSDVVVISQIPEAGWDVPSRAARLDGSNLAAFTDISTSYEVYRNKNKNVLDWLQKLDDENRIKVLRAEEIVCDSITQRCTNTSSGNSLYRDHNHPSPLFSSLIAREFEKL